VWSELTWVRAQQELHTLLNNIKAPKENLGAFILKNFAYSAVYIP
jgi:hypothetical protein